MRVLAAAVLLVCALTPVASSARRETAPHALTTRSSQLIDVNRASPQQLKTLPGIQDAYAARIIRFRPYKNKTQLRSQGVIPAATYAHIRNLIIAKQ